MRMARRAGTGLGLTETSGFCTYTPFDGTVDDLLSGLGYDMPVYPLTIRAPMVEGGLAGHVLPAGEVGHICFQGPQTFLGYVSDPIATARAITRDGVLYTGDMGCQDETGLHFAGRARWMIKPKGFQVFPGQVEDYLCELRDKVAAAGVVGVEHDVFVEAIVAFVERRPGVDLAVSELQEHAQGIASYMRPLHYVLLNAGELPLNRVAKIDYVRLDDMARQEIARLREQGGWDRT
jgi:acyl-CoA synthetase (AMP-forming)/AMP-acid ligase II